jgi:hypothetical protein
MLQAAPNKVSGVAFRIQNQVDYRAHFEASFVERSPEFSVSPATGVMEALDIKEDATSSKKGTLFKVAFSPKGFHEQPILGKLIVDTEEMRWSYKVIGQHPSHSTKVVQLLQNSARGGEDDLSSPRQ